MNDDIVMTTNLYEIKPTFITERMMMLCHIYIYIYDNKSIQNKMSIYHQYNNHWMFV